MSIKYIIGVTCQCLAIVSFNASAAIISSDWETAGDNLITQDSGSGLAWLDLTATSNRSYSDVSTKLGFGQEFDGWRYATTVEVGVLLDAFGGNNNFYNGWSTQNNGIFDSIAVYWGDLLCTKNGCAPGEGQSNFLTSGSTLGTLSDNASHINSPSSDFIDIDRAVWPVTWANLDMGSALVRDISTIPIIAPTVPIPAAVWLFSSGLIGLVGFSRRKKT